MKSVSVYLLMLLAISYPVWSEDIYLEGISVVGAKKQAYLSLDGIRVSVSEGEAIGSWQVKQIIHKAVLLSTENGKQTTLGLHTRLAPSEDKSSVSLTGDLPLEALLAPDSDEPVEVPPVPEIPQPQEIADEEIPPDHHKVHTPFGDFVVKNAENIPEKATVATELLELPSNGDIPSGYRKISTPFGAFLVEDKTQPLPTDLE